MRCLVWLELEEYIYNGAVERSEEIVDDGTVSYGMAWPYMLVQEYGGFNTRPKSLSEPPKHSSLS